MPGTTTWLVAWEGRLACQQVMAYEMREQQAACCTWYGPCAGNAGPDAYSKVDRGCRCCKRIGHSAQVGVTTPLRTRGTGSDRQGAAPWETGRDAQLASNYGLARQHYQLRPSQAARSCKPPPQQQPMWQPRATPAASNHVPHRCCHGHPPPLTGAPRAAPPPGRSRFGCQRQWCTNRTLPTQRAAPRRCPPPTACPQGRCRAPLPSSCLLPAWPH